MFEEDQPLAAKGNYNMMDDEFAPVEEEKKDDGPLEERLVSKVWKTRAQAFEEFKSILATEPESLPEFQAQFIADTNPSSQEKALEACLDYMKSSVYRPLSDKTLVKSLIEKVLSSVRANIKTLGFNVLLEFYSTKDDKVFDDINEAIIGAMANKNIKIQAAAVQAATQLLENYGPRHVNIKVLIPAVQKLASSSNAGVRSDVFKWYTECFRWIRDAIRPSIEALKKQQQDELEKMFAEVTESPTPQRRLRSEQAAAEEESKTPSKPGKKAPPEPAFDAFSLAEAKDIFGKYNDRWCDGVLNMSKWLEKKKALEELNGEASSPKLAEKSPADICGMARRLLTDSNIQVVIQSVRVLGNLAKGQRKYFSSYAKTYFPMLIHKFADKKLVNEVHAALEAFAQALDLSEMIDMLSEALNDKANIKCQVAIYIGKVVKIVPPAQVMDCGKQLATLVKKNINDGQADVRDASLTAIGCIKGIGVDLGTLLDDIPPAKLSKIDEASGMAPTKKQAADAPKDLKSTPDTAVKKRKPNAREEEKKRQPTGDAPQPPSNTTSPAPPARPAKTSNTANSTPAAYIDPTDEMTLADAEAQMSAAVPSEVMTGLGQTAWKAKQEALQQLKTWIEENPTALSSINEGIIRTLKSRMKDWKENNFNVIKETFEVVSMLATGSEMSRRWAALALYPAAVDKIADMKLNEAYYSCLSNLSQAVGPKFVAGQLIKHVGSKPKVIVESATAVRKLIDEYGMHNLDLKGTIEFAKTWIAGTNPTIKKAGQDLVLHVYKHCGPMIEPMLNDIKESILKGLKEQFSGIEVIQQTEYKSVRGEESKVVDASALLDEAMPRSAIPPKHFAKALQQLNDKNWKERKAGLEAVEAILDEFNMRILPTGLRDLIKAILFRLNDSNKACIRIALGTIGKLAEALGSHAKSSAKTVLPGIIQQLSDKQTLLRQDALTALEKWSKEAGPEIVATVACPFLLQDNPELKGELLNWLIKNQATLQSIDVKPYVPALLNCLQDRNADIRNNAEILFDIVMPIAKWETLSPLLTDMKPAALNALKPIIDRHRDDSAEVSPIAKGPRNPNTKVPPERANTTTKIKGGNKSLTRTERKGRTIGAGNPEEESKEPPVSSQPFSMSPAGNKNKRLQADIRAKWVPDEIREEYVEKMRESLRLCMSSELHKAIFSNDFKKVCEAINFLSEMAQNDLDTIVDQLDLIIKWSFTKLWDTGNTQVTKTLLEFLVTLVESLHGISYVMLEGEATVLCPILCNRAGHNNAMLKALIRDVILKLEQVYPTPKICAFLLQTLGTKNNKTKAECLEILGILIEKNGCGVILPKDIKNIASQVMSTQNDVRKAAIGTMGEIYKHIGEKIDKQCNELNRAAKDLLEQRFKTIDSNQLGSSLRRGSQVADSAKPPLSRSRSPTANRIASPSPTRQTPPRKAASQSNVDTEDTKAMEKCHVERTVSEPEGLNLSPDIQKPSYPDRVDSSDMVEDLAGDELIQALKVEVSSQSPLERNLQTLKTGEMPQKVDALVSLNDILTDVASLPELLRSADMLMEALAQVAINTFTMTAVVEIPVRFAKYYLNIVFKVCQNVKVVRETSEKALRELTEILLQCLLIDDLQRLGEKNEGASMVKLINASMLKLLENGEKTKTFRTLIWLLKKYKGTGDKILNLVAKCSLKLTKAMSSLIDEIRPLELLQISQQYIETPAKDEIGKMAIKTIFTEISNLRPGMLAAEVEKVIGDDKSKLVKWIQSSDSPGEVTEEAKGNDNEFKLQEFQQRLALMKQKYGLVHSAGPPQDASAMSAPEVVSDIKKRLENLTKSTYN